MRSLLGGIEVLGLCHHIVAEMPTQELRRGEIDLSTENLREFCLHREECEPGHVPFFELYKHVHIAGWAEIVSKDRTENGQST